MTAGLPTGRPGTALALGLLGGVLLTAWFGIGAPLLVWHADRAAELTERRALARRLEALAEAAPAPPRAPGLDTAAALLLEGGTDAVAGAALQGLVRDMATRAGATLSSVETLPAATVGGYHRIGLRLSLSASWPVLVRLLEAVEQARPRAVVDDLEVQAAQMLTGAEEALLTAGFTVHAFRAGSDLRAAQ
jgi:general secretion pathway protein M